MTAPRVAESHDPNGALVPPTGGREGSWEDAALGGGDDERHQNALDNGNTRW